MSTPRGRSTDAPLRSDLEFDSAFGLKCLEVPIGGSMELPHVWIVLGTAKLLRVDLSEGLLVLAFGGCLLGPDLSISDSHRVPLGSKYY